MKTSVRISISSVLPAFALFFAAPVVLSAAEPSGLRAPFPTIGTIDRADPALDALLAPDAHMEKVAEGFMWTEGPVWVPAQHRLLFSDVPANRSFTWSDDAGLGVFLAPSGYSGPADGQPHQGSNGMTLDAKGNIVICQHGDRRVVRLEGNFLFHTIADRFEGKRFSSPNDVRVDSAGVTYITDPPYGLQGPTQKQEIPYSGVFRVATDGKVTLLSKELGMPNGIALSLDEKTLYISNSEENRPVVIAIPLNPDGTAGKERVFFDATSLQAKYKRKGAFDGMTFDAKGNLWVSGLGGIIIVSPEGKHLGTLLPGTATANCTFGGADGRTLFIAAGGALVKIQTLTTGQGRP
ncbi:MAG TPA: SMP-30/gluconolactonase/LRE family protein [Candidatus Didemnitutus sp.]|nr:SMP-30/gluconolactonase/LRE family protein [Candidatus Didemnitutus sp.]